MHKSWTFPEFVLCANEKHNKKFRYVQSYDGPFMISKKIDIYCPIHGEFKQIAYAHLKRYGCPKCGIERRNNTKRKDTETFIKEANKKHKHKYDYSKTQYRGVKKKVEIICHKKGENGKEHGLFFQEASSHLSGAGCPRCKGEKCSARQKTDFNVLIEKFNKKHSGKYTYCKQQYKGLHSKIMITCPIHGDFSQEINSHLRGGGCPKCSKVFMDRNYFIKKASMIHNNYYDYSLVEYLSAKKEVKIVCPKHGIFLQKPDKHLCGHKCPLCKKSSLEEKVESILLKLDKEYVFQQRFSWLGRQSFDFYVPENNIAIECQGAQHYVPVGVFGGEEGFRNLQRLDKQKAELAKENGVKIIYIKYNVKKSEIEKILFKELNYG